MDVMMPLEKKVQLSTPMPIHSAKESIPELRPGSTPPRKTTPKMRAKMAIVARGLMKDHRRPSVVPLNSEETERWVSRRVRSSV